jgi:cytochrome P450
MLIKISRTWNGHFNEICHRFAGADSTAIAINSILYHLMRHTTAYKKLTAEIDAAVADGKLSIPIAYAEAVKLPYLKACINEGMRLHPSVALTMPRIVPTEGATISGFSFPGGYRIGVNGAVVQLDKDVFGQDADNFNPDRWIEGDSVRMEKTMVQFGAGARTCLGKNVSAG